MEFGQGFNHLHFKDMDTNQIIPNIESLKVKNVRLYTNQKGDACIIFDLDNKQEIIETSDEYSNISDEVKEKFLKTYPQTSWIIKHQSDKMTKNLIDISIIAVLAIAEIILKRTNGQYNDAIVSYLDKEIMPPIIVEWSQRYYQ